MAPGSKGITAFIIDKGKAGRAATLAPATVVSENTASIPAVVDVTQLAYFKVLGKGSVSQPIVVKAKIVSKIAERKIKVAGGAVMLTA
ncbi:hypothetical protein AgCh_000993 [Apium graveolens]